MVIYKSCSKVQDKAGFNLIPLLYKYFPVCIKYNNNNLT